MRTVLQRVSRARVEVGGAVVGEIGPGILALLAVVKGDSPADADALARKIVDYRIFEDGAGKMNLGIREIGGSILVVSQFTLAADGAKGRRPSFDLAASPEEAMALLDRVVSRIRDEGVRVEVGTFGAHMEISLVNTGPATFVLEIPARKGDS